MRVVAVSPHLDDAAFSAGGTLADQARRGAQVAVVTCFTGNVAAPKGFAMACQLDKGLSPDVDYMALRREEDIRAWAEIGVEPTHLPFLEAPHRGYDCATALFGPQRGDDDVADHLARALVDVVHSADLVLGPLGIGEHVDHRAVRTALERVVDPERLMLWEDWPYADRAERVPQAPKWTVDLDAELIGRRTAMCAAYTTQLGFQFGGRAAMEGRLRAITSERFHGT